jgi:hypothetical protein
VANSKQATHSPIKRHVEGYGLVTECSIPERLAIIVLTEAACTAFELAGE